MPVMDAASCLAVDFDARSLTIKEHNPLSAPTAMSTFPEPRSPSLESAFSFDDNPGITPISPNISVQSASQGGITTFWTQAGQESWLSESKRMERTASLRDEHLESFEAPQAAVEAHPMHERFCFPAENIYFLVRVYCVPSTACSLEVFGRWKACSTACIGTSLSGTHRRSLDRDMPSRSRWSSPTSACTILTFFSLSCIPRTSRLDITLARADLTDYAHSSFGAYPASTVEEWSGILHLADKWGFQSIRALSVAQIAPIALPIDKIVFGRLYGIHKWLASAYHAVCTRRDALTLEEGRRLAVDDVIRINGIRQDFCFIRVSESSLKLLEEDVESHFGFVIQTEHAARTKTTEGTADKPNVDSTAKPDLKKEEEAKAAEIERQNIEE